ncbi:hypothetical protein [Taibaiella chishuiensis]|nr:hypothetical protein [Taibaiella chishuiensis]
MSYLRNGSWLLLLVVCLSAPAQAALLSLKESMAKRLVTVKAVSKGGFMGQCLNLELHNNTGSDLSLAVDPALIFKPLDSRFQPLVAVGEEQVTVEAGKSKTVTLQTFCGKSSASGPAKNLTYAYWKQGDTVMRQVSRYIRQHRLFGSLGQHAIWTLTSGHCLSNVYNPSGKPDEGKALVAYMAGLLRQQMPEYYTHHNINTSGNGGEVFDLNLSKVYVPLNWKKESRRQMHVVIFDHNRKVYREIKSGQVSNSKGEHEISVEFDPDRDPLGVYYVQLRDDESDVWIEKRVVMQKNICQ